MKIINLQGENFKRMTAFDITPTGNTVVISGENGQGKSSVLDAIVMALAGKNSEVAKLTTKPIKAGEKHASVTVTTDQYVITRTWTEKDSYLEMTNREGGAVFKGPQALLDQMVGDLCFDPLEFSRMKPKEQRDILLGIVKLPIDLEQWELDRKMKYDMRTSIGGHGKQLKGALENIVLPDAEIPDVEISISDLMDSIQEIEAKNTEHANYQEKMIKTRGLIGELEAKLKDAKDLLVFDESRSQNIVLTNIAPFKEKLKNAEEMNRLVRTKQEKAKIVSQLAASDEEYEKLSQELDAMQNTKATALASAQFPIAGLSFSDDGVTFLQKVGTSGEAETMDAIPFAQLSSAQQLKVSMAIAMAKNPKLRVIRITDGSLLDEHNMEVLREMADKNDFQVWVEAVSNDDKVGIVIKDGEVYKNNYESTTEKEEAKPV